MTFLRQVEVEFDNGSAFNLSAEFLRIHSPAADSKVRSFGGEKVIGFFFHLYCSCYFSLIFFKLSRQMIVKLYELLSFFLISDGNNNSME